MFYDQLKRLEVGQPIFEVHALTAPASIGGEYIKIADIILKTELVTSKFGDTNLYFRHRRVQSDYKYWPKTWRQGYKDAAFENGEGDTWGNVVPAGVWPETDDEAEAFYIE